MVRIRVDSCLCILQCGTCQHMIGEWHVCTDNSGHLGMSTDAGRWCASQSTQFQRMSPRRHRINATPNPIHPTHGGRTGKGYASTLGWDRHPQKPQGVEKSIIGCITWLLTRPSRLHRRITTTAHRCPFTMRFLLPWGLIWTEFSSSARMFP